MPSIADNLTAVRAAIVVACRRASRDPGEVRVIAVTKEQSPVVLSELAAADVLDFGENRLDHLATMQSAPPPGSRFHGIGRIQGRQIPDLVSRCACLHGLCDPSHVDRLDTAAAKAGKRLPVFVQVNVSGEPTKAGVSAEALPGLLGQARTRQHLDVIGLMTMAPALAEGVDEGSIRRCFAGLRELARRHGLARLSMGMSQDYAVAIEEGATDVRIGSALFA